MADFGFLWVVTGWLLLIQGGFSQQIPVLVILMAKIDIRQGWLILGSCNLDLFKVASEFFSSKVIFPLCHVQSQHELLFYDSMNAFKIQIALKEFFYADEYNGPYWDKHGMARVR